MENNLINQKPEFIVPKDEVSICLKCGAVLKRTDEFCGDCGTKINKSSNETSLENLWSEEVDVKVKKASKWILALGIMFIVVGTFMGYTHKNTRDQAFANLNKYEDNLIWSEPINGKTVKVGELKKMVNFEYYSFFGVNYFLAIVMIAIFFWSKRAPFPAFVTAFAIYISVIVLNTLVDPKTIAQGFIVKIAVIAALINGIKAAIPTKGLARGKT